MDVSSAKNHDLRAANEKEEQKGEKSKKQRSTEQATTGEENQVPVSGTINIFR